MLRNDTFLDRYIGVELLKRNKLEREGHVSSGRLSASSLGNPLQWQILHFLGVETKPIDEYVIRKMIRGVEIEDWFLNLAPCVKERQKEVLYRNVIGYVDAVIDTSEMDFPLGVIPHEIKSVTNMKFKHIVTQSKPDRSHMLQAGLYALAMGSDHFAINYIAADDLRVKTYVLDTADVKDEIDSIIDKFDAQVLKKTVPLFEACEPWQSNLVYNNYPEYQKILEEIPFEAIKPN